MGVCELRRILLKDRPRDWKNDTDITLIFRGVQGILYYVPQWRNWQRS